MKEKILSLLPVTLVFILSLLTILPLFHSGFFPMHDDTQVQRVFEMHKSLADGMFPVRWVNDLGYGYGYPLFTFYGPLAYYVGGLFNFLVDSLTATKVMIAIAMIGSGFSMFFLAKNLWGKWGGVLSAVLYLFAPYHAVDLYVRGDVGELWAYMFLPLLFLGFYQLFTQVKDLGHSRSTIFNFSSKGTSFFPTRGLRPENGRKGAQFSIFKWVAVASIGFAGIILSHNLSAFMVTPFLLVFIFILVLFPNNKLYAIRHMLYAIILGLGLSAFYFLPVFTEIKYTNVLSQVGGGADFHDHFVCLTQLWQSQWGFGGSAKGCIDGLSFMIGKIHLILSLLGLLLLPFLWKRKQLFLSVIFCLVGLLIAVFLMLPVSQRVWEIIPQMAFLQYPWRYLLFASFFTSLLGGLVGSFILEKQKIIGIGFLLIICLGVIVLNFKYFQPQKYLSVTHAELTSLPMLQWTTSKISDEYMPPGFLKPKNSHDIPQALVVDSSTLTVQHEKIKTQEKYLLLSLAESQDVFFNLAYFPGWQARDNNMLVPVQATGKGVKIHLSAGSHAITFHYTGTMVENLGNILSVTSVIILILGIIWEGKQRYEHKST